MVKENNQTGGYQFFLDIILINCSKRSPVPNISMSQLHLEMKVLKVNCEILLTHNIIALQFKRKRF